MEFSVQRDALLDELNACIGAVEVRTTIPILGNVLIEAVGDRLFLTSSDLQITHNSSVPANITIGGSAITVKAKLFRDYVRSLGEGSEIVATASDGWLRVVSGRNKTRIATMDADSYPKPPEAPNPIATIQASVLADLFKKTKFAISQEESRFTLNGALLFISSAGVIVVATDGHRLALATERVDLASELKALVPEKAMAHLVSLLGNASTVEISEDDARIYFGLGDRSVVAQKLTGNFPAYEKVLPSGHPYKATLSAVALHDALLRVSGFADERSKNVKFAFSEGSLDITGGTTDVGAGEENLLIQYSGEAVTFGMNATYILQYLKVIGDTELEVTFKDEKSAVEWRSGGSAAYRYVSMPCR